MTKQELNRFRMILTARMRELERLIAYRDGIAIERSPDELDQMQRASELALAVSNLDREFKQLRNVRAALRRIQEGSFGTCQECDARHSPEAARGGAVGSVLYSVPGSPGPQPGGNADTNPRHPRRRGLKISQGAV